MKKFSPNYSLEEPFLLSGFLVWLKYLLIIFNLNKNLNNNNIKCSVQLAKLFYPFCMYVYFYQIKYYDIWYHILIFPISPIKTNQLQWIVDLQQITLSRLRWKREYFQRGRGKITLTWRPKVITTCPWVFSLQCFFLLCDWSLP